MGFSNVRCETNLIRLAAVCNLNPPNCVCVFISEGCEKVGEEEIRTEISSPCPYLGPRK